MSLAGLRWWCWQDCPSPRRLRGSSFSLSRYFRLPKAACLRWLVPATSVPSISLSPPRPAGLLTAPLSGTTPSPCCRRTEPECTEQRGLPSLQPRKPGRGDLIFDLSHAGTHSPQSCSLCQWARLPPTGHPHSKMGEKDGRFYLTFCTKSKVLNTIWRMKDERGMSKCSSQVSPCSKGAHLSLSAPPGAFTPFGLGRAQRLPRARELLATCSRLHIHSLCEVESRHTA